MLDKICSLFYVVAYLGRYSYNSNITLIMADYNIDHATAGLVTTFFFFGVLVLFMHAINNIVTGIAPLRLRTTANSGRLAGILNACCYVGSTISSYVLGLIADVAGWNVVMYVFLGVALLAVVVGLAAVLLQRKTQS